MKRKLTLLAATFLFSLQTFSQAPNWLWAKGMGGTFNDVGNSIATDVLGNVYTTGLFLGTVDFDPGAGVFNLNAAGGEDIFILKLDSAGNFMWAKQIGGISINEGNSIALDASGNVYITGRFQGTVDFDPGAGTFNLISVGGSQDIFISKLDNFGNFVWAKAMGGASADHAYSIAIDALGNVYTTGYFWDTADFDPGTGIFNLTSVGGSGDIFISKLDNSGNFVWAKAMGGVSDDYAYSIAIDASGNVYTTGGFSGTSDFDPGAGIFNLTTGVTGIFVSKLDGSGNFVWAKAMGGTNDAGFSIAIDASGNVYTTGQFVGTGDFDPGVGTFNLISTGGTADIFISKLDAAGNFIWAKAMGGTNTDRGNSIAIDASGNVYTTGSFQGTADFDPGAGTFNLTTSGIFGIFISKLYSSGNFAWAKTNGGAGGAGGASMVLDASGNVNVTGNFIGPTITFGSATLTNAGNSDIFIAKLSSATYTNQQQFIMPTTGTQTATTCGGIFYDSGGSGGNYSSNENGEFIFCSAVPGQFVGLIFTSMVLSDAGDIFRLYSGTGTGGPLLQTLQGPLNIASFCQNVVSQDIVGGCLTAQFISNSSGVADGWAAMLSCNPTSSATPAGINCANPAVIPTVPFSEGTHCTQCMLNDYQNQTGICNTSYGGEDRVYSYTTTGPECDSIIMSNTNGSPALAIYQGCPGAGGVCLTPTPMVGNSFMQFNFPAAATYYIIVDEVSGYACYDLSITPCATGCIGVTITNTLTNQNAPVGGTATWSVSVNGTPPITYQWYKNSLPISGATSNSYTTPPLIIGDNGNTYYCVAVNCSGNSNATSNTATLTVTPAVPVNQYSLSTKLPYTVAPFPNPKPLISGNTSTPASVIKICADGSQATRMSYTNNDGSVNSNNIRFWIASDPFGNYVDTTGYFINYNIAGNVITATYAHPKYLSAFNLPFRKDSIFIVDYTNATIPKYKIPIRMYRAPVLFVHGFAGTTATFSAMKQDFTTGSNNYYPLALCNIGYYGTSLQNFATNSQVVRLLIPQSFYNSLSAGFSAGKVDVVAHSMGGILTRLYLQNNYGNKYKGDINKVITLNTPHSGSHIANYLVFHPLNIALCGASALFNFQSFTCNGAAIDMQTHSYATDNILNSPSSLLAQAYVPIHTISSYINNGDIGNCLSSIPGISPVYIALVGINALTVPAIFYSFTHQKDGVVRDDSQQGGLSGSQTSTIIYQCHIGASANPTNISEVKQLLCDDPNGGRFSLSGFNPPNLLAPPRPDNNFANYPQTKRITTTPFVDITAPINSDIFIPNQQITISINSDTSVHRILVLAGNAAVGITYFDTTISSTTTNLSYTIPVNAIGQLEIDAIGFDIANNINCSDSVTFNINANAFLDSIEINPNPILVPTNLQTSFQATGYFSDGIPRDLNLISGVQYNVANPSVAQIISPGVIEGLTIDSTLLTISYQNDSTTIQVYVYDGDSLSHALFSSNSNTVCDSGQVIFYDLSTGHPQNILWLFPGGNPSTSTDTIPVIDYNIIGVYDVTLIATYATRTDTLTLPAYVTVNQSPSSPTIVLNFDTLVSSPSDYYQWYLGSTIISGATSQNYVPTQNGFYTVIITDINGCSASSLPFDVNYIGIIENNSSSAINIYPNPNSGIFTVTIKTNQPNKFSLKVLDTMGRIVYEQKDIGNETKHEVDLRKNAPGIYFVEIIMGEQIARRKIVKQ